MSTEETDGAIELSSGVYWVGAIDWNGRDFHGFTTPGGTTYNSYLIVGEKDCTYRYGKVTLCRGDAQAHQSDYRPFKTRLHCSKPYGT